MLFRQACCILAVAEHGSFTRAADALHVSQPALSQTIRHAEELLGTQLFDRSARNVKPTDAGRIYIEHLRRALRELDAGRRAMSDIASLHGGHLRIAFLPLFTTHLVGPLMQEFYRRHPTVDVSVHILAQAALESALVEDRLDVGLAFKEVQNNEIDVIPLHDDELCLIVGPSHPAYTRNTLKVSLLDGRDLALLDTSFITRAPIDHYFHINGVRPRVAIEANSADSIIAIIRGSTLATVMPAASARNIADLKAIPLIPSVGQRTLSVLQRRGAYRSAACRALIEILGDWEPKSQGPEPAMREKSPGKRRTKASHM